MRDLGNIYPARSDISRHQYLERTVAEAVHRSLPPLL